MTNIDCRSSNRTIFLALVFLWAPQLEAGMALNLGDLTVLQTGGGVPLLTETVSNPPFGGMGVPILEFSFGFATAEELVAGTILDAFSVSLQAVGGQDTAILLTADAGGVAWAPLTPGTIFVDEAAIQRTPIAFPDIGQPMGNQAAFHVATPVPDPFTDRELLIHFDLFDNQNSIASVGWFGGVAVVPEPSVGLLFICGGATLLVRTMRNRMRSNR